MMHLPLAFLTLLATYVAGRTCYPGQEPGPDSGGLQWSLTEKDPSQCTEYRLGGLNTRPHQILHEVTIGDDRDLHRLKSVELKHEQPARCGGSMAPACPPEWHHWGTSCYLVTEASFPWSNATDECAKLFGILAVPHSQEENEFIVDYVIHDQSNAWIDCTDQQTEGAWVCEEDGVNVAFRYWDDDQPNDYLGQDCAVISRYYGSGLQWHDYSCTTNHPALCKRHNYTCQEM